MPKPLGYASNEDTNIEAEKGQTNQLARLLYQQLLFSLSSLRDRLRKNLPVSHSLYFRTRSGLFVAVLNLLYHRESVFLEIFKLGQTFPLAFQTHS